MDKDKEANLSANTSQNLALVWMRILTSVGSWPVQCSLRVESLRILLAVGLLQS